MDDFIVQDKDIFEETGEFGGRWGVINEDLQNKLGLLGISTHAIDEDEGSISMVNLDGTKVEGTRINQDRLSFFFVLPDSKEFTEVTFFENGNDFKVSGNKDIIDKLKEYGDIGTYSNAIKTVFNYLKEKIKIVKGPGWKDFLKNMKILLLMDIPKMI